MPKHSVRIPKLILEHPWSKISQGGESGDTGVHPLPNFSPVLPRKRENSAAFLFLPVVFLAGGACGTPVPFPIDPCHAPRAGLSCSSQPESPSGPYLGPEEKIKADRALAPFAPWENSMRKEGENPQRPAPLPLAVTLKGRQKEPDPEGFGAGADPRPHSSTCGCSSLPFPSLPLEPRAGGHPGHPHCSLIPG